MEQWEFSLWFWPAGGQREQEYGGNARLIYSFLLQNALVNGFLIWIGGREIGMETHFDFKKRKKFAAWLAIISHVFEFGNLLTEFSIKDKRIQSKSQVVVQSHTCTGGWLKTDPSVLNVLLLLVDWEFNIFIDWETSV